MDNTIKYYDENAESFIARTVNADITGMIDRFLCYVPKGGHIIDAGCGSGRDSLYFIKRCYNVLSFDASSEMAEHSSRLTGQKTIHATFQDIELESGSYDAVWACASLLHVPKDEIAQVIKRLFDALKPGGVFYMSFKYGDEDYVKDGRNFYIYNEQTVKDVLADIDGYKIMETIIEQDGRKELKHQRWINMIIKKLG